MDTPSKGSMRAAKALFPERAKLSQKLTGTGLAALETLHRDALIIDRETKAGLMLEALKKATALIQTMCCSHRGACSLDNAECYAGEQLAAIHAAENGGQCPHGIDCGITDCTPCGDS